MKILLSAAALTLALTCSGMAYADEGGHDKDLHGHPHCEKMLSKLPEDKAQMFRATMEDVHQKNKPLMEKMHKLHEELHAIVTAPKFDKDQFLAKSAESQKLHDEMHANWKEGLASALSQLSQEQRKQVAEAMHHKGHWHHGKHEHQEHKDHQEQKHDEGDDDSSSN